jgi:hypothetical protein
MQGEQGMVHLLVSFPISSSTVLRKPNISTLLSEFDYILHQKESM